LTSSTSDPDPQATSAADRASLEVPLRTGGDGLALAGESGIAPHAADPAAGIVDFHLYTFNAVDATEKWRQAYLAKLGAAVAAA
jgi:hypothetical protein